MTTLSSQVFHMQSLTIAAMNELKDSIKALKPDREGALVSVANPKLCAFCDIAIRRCTPTASLRHMIKCEHCSDSTCRHLAISEHLFSFKMAPLVGSPDCCCWCGIPWPECGRVAGHSQGDKSLSPDARSKHKKLCHTTVHESLQSTDPDIVLKAKTTLDRIWKETGHPTAAYDSQSQKRERSCDRVTMAVENDDSAAVESDDRPKLRQSPFVMTSGDEQGWLAVAAGRFPMKGSGSNDQFLSGDDNFEQ